jgi:flagellar P-ring protein precursor FlgI
MMALAYRHYQTRLLAGLLLGAVCTAPAFGEVLVQDIAHLQGEHVNRLMGFGLVVGLNGTGDGDRNLPTARALLSLHRRYGQYVASVADIANSENVAIVTVEVETPRHGWRTGERLNVVVSAISAESLAGGQLLTTPLQYSPLPADAPPDLARIWALAGGRIEMNNDETPTRGVIRDGAVMEADYFHSFIANQAVTLVLDEAKASFPMAQMMARSINQELQDPSIGGLYDRGEQGQMVVVQDIATALGPKTVRVRVPSYEMGNPANFISQILQTPLFLLPKQEARVVINKTTHNITLTGTVTIRPTVVTIPGLGTVAVGGGNGGNLTGVAGVTTEDPQSIEFQQLLATLQQLKLSPEQTVQVVEQLHETGTLQAQLVYTE